MSIVDRIKEVMSDKSLKIADLSSEIGLPYRTIQGYLLGDRKVSVEFVDAMSTHLRISPTWLISGIEPRSIDDIHKRVQPSDPTSNDFVQIQRYAVSASAGHGAQNDEEFGTGWYAFNKKWLEKRKLSPKDLSVISVRGDSMEPKFSDKDLVLLDHAQNTPIDGFIYTIRVGNELYVKSIQTKGEDTIYMVSANPEYPPLEINKNDDAQIIGRVVASMHEW